MNTDNYYTNLNTNIRFTDDISFKLLGLVPLFSGAGILVAIMRSEYLWSPAIYAVGAFGALITLGLFRWELRNIQNCLWLIHCGRVLEQTEDATKPGQFYQRPGAPMRIGKTEAEKLVYSVTIFTWLLLPWLVYSTAQVKNNSAPVINETLNSIYLAFAAIVGIFAVVSLVVPLNVQPKPPSTT
ncbi:MAG TPA: hypothetical protein VK893_05200 [Pyrinomonadaceae bacterium]|nr:hypothetical protein [Pyrinomonadaceae bacterium]